MTGIIITLLIILYRIPLINILGDKGMGYYSTALVIYLLFMTCIAYGLPNAVTSLISTQRSKGQNALAYQTARSSLLYAVVAGGGCALLLFLCADFIASYLMNSSYSALAIRAFAPGLVFISLLGALHGIFMGSHAVSISKTAHKIENFFVAILSIVLAFLFTGYGKDIAITNSDTAYESAYSAFGAALGMTAGVFIAFIFSFILYGHLRKKLEIYARKDKESKAVPNRELIKNIITAMVPFVLTLVIFHLSSLLDYAIFNRMMNVQGHKESSYIILLGMLNGKYEFYISIPLLIINWFATSKVPVMTKIIKDGNKRKIQSKIGQCVRYCMILTIPWTMIYILFPGGLMNLLFTGTNDIPAMLLRTGAVSIIFYSLAAISNAALNALEDWSSVSKNTMIALAVQVICLLIMMIILQWGIIAVVVSRIIFSAALFILNEHTLRERTGYIQEHKRTFNIPIIASLIMGAVTFVLYLILNIFISDKIAVIIVIAIAIPVYIMALVFLGGITQREMYKIPGGKYLAPLCRKLHLVK